MECRWGDKGSIQVQTCLVLAGPFRHALVLLCQCPGHFKDDTLPTRFPTVAFINVYPTLLSLPSQSFLMTLSACQFPWKRKRRKKNEYIKLALTCMVQKDDFLENHNYLLKQLSTVVSLRAAAGLGFCVHAHTHMHTGGLWNRCNPLMHTLIFQIIIKRWSKGDRNTHTHTLTSRVLAKVNNDKPAEESSLLYWQSHSQPRRIRS